jgi:hypothetical protein
VEKTKTFTQMVEYNEHEGECWSFWLQVDGNQDALNELWGLIEAEEEYTYQFTDDVVYEWELQTLLDHGNFGYGYMNQHNKVAGKLTLPNGFQVNDIYKGQIKNFFKEE